jgi:hypothetical protein
LGSDTNPPLVNDNNRVCRALLLNVGMHYRPSATDFNRGYVIFALCGYSVLHPDLLEPERSGRREPKERRETGAKVDELLISVARKPRATSCRHHARLIRP